MNRISTESMYLGYDKYNQEHYTAYRSPDLKGLLPLRVQGKGDSKSFVIRVQGDDGQPKDAQYTVYRDDRGNLKVAAPGESAKNEKEEIVTVHLTMKSC